ncbi:MAG TPA: quercetin 2,3-dioxygenase [Gemmatimonadales bacterium]|nr:quercetin 2,3-dioxygenase [Gemmatimonadales bacterium]
MAASIDPAGPGPRVRHVPAGEGPAIWVVGDTYTFKAVGRDTGGRLTVWEAEIPPGAGPPPHLHREQDEAYYVLDGELEVRDGDRTFMAERGSFVFIPRGAVHCFRNVGQRPSRMLLWMTPAGFEDFLLAVGQPARPGEAAPPLGPEELAKTVELAPRHGMELRLPDEPGAAGR